MAGKKQSNLKSVEPNIEEMNEQIRSHRKKLARRILCVVCLLLILAAGIELWLSVRTFSSYAVLSESEQEDSDAVSFCAFGNDMLKYSNDGAALVDVEDQQVWNQSYEMTNPTVKESNNYAVIYDRGNIGIYLFSKSKMVCHIETTNPIVSVSVSDQGILAALTKQDDSAYVKVYDKTGEEIASGEFYEENGGFPVDIALGYDGKKMAIDMVDVSDGNLKSTITFYNFGSVGQNEINNNVGTYTYSDLFIPEIEYVSDDKMIALGNNEVVIFDGAEKPEVSAEIFPEEDPESIVYDSKHIAILKAPVGDENSREIELYDLNGKKTMDITTDLIYNDVYFLNDGELCLTNDMQCEIYTSHRVKKFSYTFDQKICRILSRGTATQYVFVFEDAIQEVHLK